MSKSSSKKARVVYDSGNEQYILQYWSEGLGEWCDIRTFPFVADAQNPDGGKNYIHYELLTIIISFAQQGYSLDI